MLPHAPPFETASVAPIDLAFVALLLALMLAARRWIVAYALLVLPGTLLHEGAHWLVGMLTGARPTRLRLLPVRSTDGRRWTLASIGFRRVHALNALPIAFAPLVLAPLAVLLALLALGAPHGAWQHWVGLYAATAAAVSCLPSPTDWKLAFSRPSGVLLYAIAGVVTAWFVWRA